jgi:hypothetical protein
MASMPGPPPLSRGDLQLKNDYPPRTLILLLLTTLTQSSTISSITATQLHIQIMFRRLASNGISSAANGAGTSSHRVYKKITRIYTIYILALHYVCMKPA